MESVRIGSQIWSAKNLDVSTFRNGDPIPEIKSAAEWFELNEPAWCVYDNFFLNGEKYGKLYTWDAVDDPRGLAPFGWHVATDDEWKILMNYLGGDLVAGNKLKSREGWIRSGNGTDEFGFCALPGGCIMLNEFFGQHTYGYWWTASACETMIDAWCYALGYEDGQLQRGKKSGNYGFSVRCVKDYSKSDSDELDLKLYNEFF